MALLNLFSSGTILYVSIATEGAVNRKMIAIEMKACEKSFRMTPGITYFPVLVVETFKVEIGEIVTKIFKKGHVGCHKGLKRVWIDFFHPKYPSLWAVYSATLFEFCFVMYCYMNVHNTPMGVLWTYYWEYQRIFAVFLSIFGVTTKKIFFQDIFYVSQKMKKYMLNIFSFHHFTGSETC